MTITDHLDLDVVVRPQPLGLFDGPAGLVLLPAVAALAPLLDALARGHLPATWPPEAAVLAAVLADDIDGALAALESGPADPTTTINRFVLAPTAAHLAAARVAAAGRAELGVVVDAAAYASGLSDRPPSPDHVDGEFAALALTVRAARALEFKDRSAAQRHLREARDGAAAVGPVLEARILAMLAEHAGIGEPALVLYDEAIAKLAGTDFTELQAEYHLERALVAHQMADEQRHRLVEAIRSYQSALIVLSEERHPDRFALANMNIAIAILAMPMTQASDQVRLGVAVQSLRAALRVYRPETHPYEWSSSQMNLANALQYLPSKHRLDNLAEAVELYEAVLAVRSPRSDPAGYARVLANQANALAHLAIFDHADEKYRAAAELFARAGEHDAVSVVERQRAEIAAQREVRS